MSDFIDLLSISVAGVIHHHGFVQIESLGGKEADVLEQSVLKSVFENALLWVLQAVVFEVVSDSLPLAMLSVIVEKIES